MCVATLWLTAADSVQDLHLIPFSLQPKLQHQWILLQSYNKWAEKQQACSIVFPECSHNLSKVTTNEAEPEKKTPIFFPGYTALSFKKKKMTKAPLPDSVRIGKVSLAVFQTVTFFLKSNPFSGICIDCVCRTLLYRHVRHARTPVRVSSEWWCRWDGGGNSLCCLYGNRGPSRAKFINCSRILPCGTIFFITFAVWLNLYASIERLWSSGFVF